MHQGISSAEDNLAFVISCKQSDVPLSDISCDGHSGWVNNGVRKFTFFRNKEKKYSIVSKKRIPKDKMSPSHFLLVRKYVHHRKYPDCKKMIAYARNFRDQICSDLVFLQYFFTGEIHSIKRIKHGDAKKATHSYCQTKPSVLEKARRDINSMAVRSVATNINDTGGVKHANNPADMITTKQLHDMKHNQSKSTCKQPHGSENEISHVIDMGQNEFRFITREIKQFPEPFIVLGIDEQLKDLERFCCDDAEFVIMSVNPTFKISKFNIIPISFQSLTLSTNCECISCPVVMGPLLVHFSKTEEIYTAFSQTLQRLRYYTNDSKSNNFKLKHWLGFRELSIPKFIKELASFIEAEKNDTQKAYCNLAGKYFVRAEFREQLECKDFFQIFS